MILMQKNVICRSKINWENDGNQNEKLQWKGKKLQAGAVSKWQWKVTLAVGFAGFMLDIKAVISCDSDIQIGPFNTPNSYTQSVIQISWRTQSGIKSFWWTKSSCNLLGQHYSEKKGFSAFTLDIPTQISWGSDIQISQFKNQIHPHVQDCNFHKGLKVIKNHFDGQNLFTICLIKKISWSNSKTDNVDHSYLIENLI